MLREYCAAPLYERGARMNRRGKSTFGANIAQIYESMGMWRCEACSTSPNWIAYHDKDQKCQKAKTEPIWVIIDDPLYAADSIAKEK